MAGWGVAYVPSAWLVEDVPPLLAAALRLSLAGGLLLAVMVLSGRSLHPEVGWGVVAWIGFTQTTLFYGATFWGLDREGAGLAAVLANTEGGEIGWAVDGRVHQHVQIDGTSTDEMARWKGDRLELHLGVTGSLDLKRELRVVEDGAVLEMKLELSGPGVPRKMARKVVFVRGAS